MPETLLEQGIPTKELNKIARKEKLGHAKPPISKIHYWWTRKPLIVSRAVIVASLTQNPDKKRWEELVGINEHKKPFEKDLSIKEINGLLNEAKGLYPDLTVFDPFAGSGMILFEALRLGLNVEGWDYNPVAYLIMKATLDYPKRYGEQLRKDVETEANRIIAELKKEYGHLYSSKNGTVLGYIWAFQVRCNSCGKLTPLVNDWVLRKNKENNKSIYVTYTINGEKISYNILEGDKSNAPPGTVAEAEGTCIYCKRLIPNSEIVEQMRSQPIETIIAVVLKGNKRKIYVVPDEDEESKLKQAKELLNQIPNEYLPSEITTNEMASTKYLPSFLDLFNPRQLLLLSSLAKKINETAKRLVNEKGYEYGKAVATYLSLLLAKLVDYNTRVTMWDNAIQKVGHSLTNRRPSMTWRYVEPNPFEKFSGSFSSMLHDVLDGLDFASKRLTPSSGNVNLFCHSILREAGRKYSLIITDPPYLDDVQYGELSEFFYVWHKRAIGFLYPELSSERVETSEEIDVGHNRTKEDFWERFSLASKRIYDMLTDDGLLVVFFAQRRQEVWEKVIDTFVKTGFQITSAIPISTESENNVIARGKKSIYYSLIITARKRKTNYEASVTQVKQEIREAIKSRLQEFVQLDYNRGELLLASVGVALNVATKYSYITSFSKESVAKTALNYAREAAIDELTNREIKEIVGENINLDREAELYIWTLRGGSRELDYQEFNQTVKSLGINEEELIKKRLVIKQKDSGKVVVANAFQRTDSIEEKGEDGIKGQSQVDWFHRFIRKYNQKKSITVFNEISSQSALPEKFFVAFSKLLAYYGVRYKDLSDDEFRIATEAVRNFDDVMGGTKGGLDNWFK